jgi:hypothetical protein
MHEASGDDDVASIATVLSVGPQPGTALAGRLVGAKALGAGAATLNDLHHYQFI